LLSGRFVLDKLTRGIVSMFNIRISDLPPVGKFFVGLFTTLVLLVCIWAATIFYLEKGLMSDYEPAEYYDEYEEMQQEELQQDVDEILSDSEAVLAPEWDSTMGDVEAELDSAELVEGFQKYDSEESAEELSGDMQEYEELYEEDSGEHLRHNIGLAHTHISVQTLLFFAMGFVFLFTSVGPGLKKITLSLLAVSILVHAIGLTGEGFHWVFSAMLTVSGIVILVFLLYMALMVYIDLGRKSSGGANRGEG